MKQKKISGNLRFQLAISITAFIVFIETVLLIFSVYGKRRELYSINTQISSNIEHDKIGLSEDEIDRRVNRFIYNIVFLVFIIILTVAGGVLYIFEKIAGGYIKYMATFNSRDILEENSTYYFTGYPNNEVGVLAQNFNTLLSEIRDYNQTLQNQVESKTLKLREALELARHEKENAEKLSRHKSEFLSNISHELRTPLNAILGYCQLISRQAAKKNDDSLKSDVDQIGLAGESLLALINDILHFSESIAGVEETEFEEFDVIDLVNEVSSSVRNVVVEKENSLSIHLPQRATLVNSDREKFRQIFFHLVENAVKFTTQGEIFIRLKVDDDNIFFEVEDTGLGISEDEMPHLFNAFTQKDASETKEAYGSGLGLAIVKKNCDILGGQITAQSSKNKGSIFSVRLPFQGPRKNAVSKK